MSSFSFLARSFAQNITPVCLEDSCLLPCSGEHAFGLVGVESTLPGPRLGKMLGGSERGYQSVQSNRRKARSGPAGWQKENKKRRYERRLSTTECTALARVERREGRGRREIPRIRRLAGRRRLILSVGNPFAPDDGALGFEGFGGGKGQALAPGGLAPGREGMVCVRGHWGRVSDVSGLMLDGARSISKFCLSDLL